MPIITPSIFTPFYDEELIQSDDLQTVSEEIYKKIGLNNNRLLDLKPIGSIIFININQPGVVLPNSSVWQECNGSEIVNPLSPLRSIGILQNFVPDLRDRYLRVAPDFSTNPKGGSQEHSLQHNHSTGNPSSTGGLAIEDKGDRNHRVPHTHAVAVQYENPTTMNSPAFYKTIAYMKIV